MVGQIFDFLCRSSGITTNLPVDFVQILVLYTVVLVLDPEHLLQQIRAAGFQRCSAAVLQCGIGQSHQCTFIFRPIRQISLDVHTIFGHRILDLERSDICLHHSLSKVIEVRGKHLIDFVHFHLFLEEMLHIMVDHLQQFY